MDTRYLKEFVVLAEKCNYADAAETLFISQSSLFKHVKSIEHELDIVLFQKNGNRISLSEEGKIFLQYAQTCIVQEEVFRNEITHYRKRHNTVVNIGFEYRIVNLLIAFRMKNSQYLVRQLDTDPVRNQAVNMLRGGKCELAFLVNFRNEDQEFEQIPVLTDRDAVVLYQSHPLARRDSVTFEDICREDFVVLGEGDNQKAEQIKSGDFVRPLFMEHGQTPNIVFNANRGTEMVEYVRREMGISILFKKSVYAMNMDNIVTVDIVPSHKIEVSLCYVKGVPLSAGAKAMMDFIRHIVETGEIEDIIRNRY
jgi:DNA-binding transcriptional LysR family regulator